MQSVAVLRVQKYTLEGIAARNEEKQGNREKTREKTKGEHLCYCGNEMRCRLVPFIILLFYR